MRCWHGSPRARRLATGGSCSSCRLLKKAHLRRWLASPLAATYLQYVSLGLWRAALQPDLFEQPGDK
jgi:hypothetical protein